MIAILGFSMIASSFSIAFISLSTFSDPLLGGASFLYIVARVASQPSTLIAMNPYLDTCLIIVLLVVVE